MELPRCEFRQGTVAVLNRLVGKMPAHADLDHPHIHLTLDFIVLLLGRGPLLLADPAAEASREGESTRPLRVKPTLYDPAALEAALSA